MRLRLIFSFILVVAVAILSVVYLARQGAAGEVRNFMLRGGMGTSESLAADLEAYYALNGSWTGVEQQLQELLPGQMHGMAGRGAGQNMMNQRLRVSDADGKIVADTTGTSINQPLSSAEIENSTALLYNNQTVGYLLVEGAMGYTRQDETLLVSRITRAALIAALIAGGLSLLLALYLAYRLIRPVQALTEAANSMANGDLTQRVPVNGKDEMAVLGTTFNQMAESLQRYEENRKAMTADIAHELRNPLAVQRANLEALIDGVYPLTAANLSPILEQNQLLTHLVDDLRILAIADAGQLKLEIVPTDLPELVQRNLERYAPQAQARQISLIGKVSPHARAELSNVSLDPMRMEQILGNLISNAMRYTPAGGSIEVAVDVQGQKVYVTVRDTGPGIPPEALTDIFDRFFRIDKARSRSEGGSGLGLAIARRLAEAHGGSLTASNHPEGGALFRLQLTR